MKKNYATIGIVCFLCCISICSCGKKDNNKVETYVTEDPENSEILDKDNIIIYGSDTEDATILPNDEKKLEDEMVEVDAIDIANCFNLPIEEILKKYGDSYAVINTGIEDTEKGYEYTSGLIFVVCDDEKTLSRIDCKDSIIINGVHGGMKFDEIMKFLGDEEVQCDDIAEDEKYYSLTYQINDLIICFRSCSADGTNSTMSFNHIH